MELWTVREPLSGRYRLMINFGGRPYWCMFDYAVLPVSDVHLVRIELSAGTDDVSRKWFPHLRQGMICGLMEAQERGRRLVGTRVEVQKVYEHSVDTTAHGCERYGHSFICDLIWKRAVQVDARTQE